MNSSTIKINTHLAFVYVYAHTHTHTHPWQGLPCRQRSPKIQYQDCIVLSSSVVSNSLQAHGLYPARLLCPWGFFRQEYGSGLPCPPPGDLPNSGIEHRSPTLQADSLPYESPGKPKIALASRNHRGFRMGNTCKSKADSCQWMAKTTTIL